MSCNHWGDAPLGRKDDLQVQDLTIKVTAVDDYDTCSGKGQMRQTLNRA